jgi:dTDP-4-amino-4,6-dideoxygalactose transaminase
MDAILAAAAKHKVPVIEDACQAHLAEWKGKKVSSLGDLGCFSFQASKNLNCGEGGAVITNNPDLADRAWAYHNNGRRPRASGSDYMSNGCNLRMTEFQEALLLEQMTRLEDQARTRERNAQHLSKQLASIPGIRPAGQYQGCTRNAFHLYMFHYDREKFDGLDRARFMKALSAEGIPNIAGYRPLNKEPFLKQVLQSKAYKRIYSEKQLAEWEDRNRCPVNDRLCAESVWFPQTMMLGNERDMDQIAEAIRKIQKHARELKG